MEHLSPVQEDYLEAILGLVQRKGAARVRDIALSLDVHKSTVTAALKALGLRGLVNYSPYETATLTPEGATAAAEVSRKHRQIQTFLMEVLHLDEAAAESNACRMEHAMDRDVLERIALFGRFAARRPALAAALKEFRTYARRNAAAEPTDEAG